MALAFLMMLAAQPASLPLATHDFDAFEVGCDNMRSCQLVGMPPSQQTETQPPGVGLILYRKGGAGAPVTVTLNGWDLEDASGPIIVDGDDRRWTVSKDGQVEGDTLGLARAIASAKSARLLSEDGTVKARLPTKGAAAAMRWIDEQQKRAGTVTALVARGPAPASEIPPVPPLPDIEMPGESSAPPKGMAAADLAGFKSKFDCSDDLPVSEPDYYRLDSGHTLALIFCTLGAYQGTSLAVIVPEQGKPFEAPLDMPWPADELDGENSGAMLVNADYDSEGRLLWEDSRGRGLSDCGSSTAWAWDGRRFRIAFHSRLNRCEGVTTRIPLWQTRNRPDE